MLSKDEEWAGNNADGKGATFMFSLPIRVEMIPLGVQIYLLIITLLFFSREYLVNPNQTEYFLKI